MILLDSSALLAYFRAEPGADIVTAALPQSAISIVNLAEVLSKAVEYGGDAQSTLADIHRLGISIAPFDEEQAVLAAELRRVTVPKGLSLGDRVCLALGKLRGWEVLTGERKWKTLPHGATVTLIR